MDLSNFNITEAKIIDLKNEASTWALIYQPWNIYTGILTKKDINKYIKLKLSNLISITPNMKKITLLLLSNNFKIKYNIGKEKN